MKPIDVTLLGITTEVRLLLSNAWSPIFVTELSIIRSPLQPELVLITPSGFITEYVPPLGQLKNTVSALAMGASDTLAKIAKKVPNTNFFITQGYLIG